MTSKWTAYSRNVYSQNGEDGILHRLFDELRIVPTWACEFGTLDGTEYSNTFTMVKKGMRAVYIESDAAYYTNLEALATEYPAILPVHAHVGYEGENTLDAILSRTPIPIDFDILSIDIDSYDYQVWRKVETYRPKVVVIEINSSVGPKNMDHIHDGVNYQGTGFGPMVALSISKGYTLICHTGNLIFVRNDLTSRLETPISPPLDCFNTGWIR